MTIDGYCHCGISKYQPVDVVLRVMNKHAVDRAVLCQHLGEYDNSYLAEVVKDSSGTIWRRSAWSIPPNLMLMYSYAVGRNTGNFAESVSWLSGWNPISPCGGPPSNVGCA